MAEKKKLTPDLGPAERDYVFAVAMKYVKNEVEADDVAQEALLLAHRHRASFAGRARYSTWLYRVAATAALMHLRKGRRRGKAVSLDAAPAHRERPCPRTGPADIAEARETLVATGRAVERLKPKYRDVFKLRFAEGKTDAEVATALGLSLTAAKTRAFRARAQVRETLAAA